MELFFPCDTCSHNKENRKGLGPGTGRGSGLHTGAGTGPSGGDVGTDGQTAVGWGGGTPLGGISALVVLSNAAPHRQETEARGWLVLITREGRPSWHLTQVHLPPGSFQPCSCSPPGVSAAAPLQGMWHPHGAWPGPWPSPGAPGGKSLFRGALLPEQVLCIVTGDCVCLVAGTAGFFLLPSLAMGLVYRKCSLVLRRWDNRGTEGGGAAQEGPGGRLTPPLPLSSRSATAAVPEATTPLPCPAPAPGDTVPPMLTWGISEGCDPTHPLVFIPSPRGGSGGSGLLSLRPTSASCPGALLPAHTLPTEQLGFQLGPSSPGMASRCGRRGGGVWVEWGLEPRAAPPALPLFQEASLPQAHPSLLGIATASAPAGDPRHACIGLAPLTLAPAGPCSWNSL